MIVCFVDIGGIFDDYCLNFLFIISCLKHIKIEHAFSYTWHFYSKFNKL